MNSSSNPSPSVHPPSSVSNASHNTVPSSEYIPEQPVVYASNVPLQVVPSADPAYQYRSKTVYTILALLLGPFGIHEFYFGYKAAGWWMLLLCIFSGGSLAPILWIWAIIDIFTTTAPEGYFKYGNVYLPKGMNPAEAAAASAMATSPNGIQPPSKGRSKHFYYAIYMIIGFIGLFFIIGLIGAIVTDKSSISHDDTVFVEQTSSDSEATSSESLPSDPEVTGESLPSAPMETRGESQASESAVDHKEAHPSEENISNLTWEQVCELADPDTDLSDFQIESLKKEYIGQRVKWTGKVLEVDKDIFSRVVITMRVGKATGFLSRKEIECKLVNDKNQSKKAAKYRKNDSITIIGTIQDIDDIMGNDVVLKDSIIVK